jgi:hypothetical protein
MGIGRRVIDRKVCGASRVRLEATGAKKNQPRISKKPNLRRLLLTYFHLGTFFKDTKTPMSKNIELIGKIKPYPGTLN